MDFTSSSSSSNDCTWWLFTFPSLVSCSTDPYFFVFLLLVTSLSISFSTWALSSAGPAWSRDNRTRRGRTPIDGPRGLPFLGLILTLTNTLPHRALARMSRASTSTRQLMAFSIGSTPAVVSSDPTIAKEILTSASFASRPLKRSARELMFARAIGFAPAGSYWRLLRHTASAHLFCPRRIAAHEPGRQSDAHIMLGHIRRSVQSTGSVRLRPHLQLAALNNIMGSVFGKRYGDDSKLAELRQMVREGFELLGAFNWSDHLPWLAYFYDPEDVSRRCSLLVPHVKKFVKEIVDEHRRVVDRTEVENKRHLRDDANFVDVLLSLEKLAEDGCDDKDKLEEDDMIAVLWVIN